MAITPFLDCPVRAAGVFLTTLVVTLAGGASARSEPLPLAPAEQAKVNSALARGLLYLLKTQGNYGTWAPKDGPHPVAYAALPGLTLLECGVPPHHPAVQKAAIYVRNSYLKLEDTYDQALAILFLDRLEQYNRNFVEYLDESRTDRMLIEVLALRLIAAQTTTGGWTYTSKAMDTPTHLRLLKTLRKRDLKQRAVPRSLRSLAVFQDADKLMVKEPEPKKSANKKKARVKKKAEPASDNSNTHFALLALWAAKRHHIPVERTFKLITKRFRTSQSPSGSWAYAYVNGDSAGGNPSMTCAGLLGLAMEYGFADSERDSEMLPAPASVAQLVGSVVSPSPFSVALAVCSTDQALTADAAASKRAKDDAIAKGLKWLGGQIGEAPPSWRSTVPLPSLYFLWAVERVAMLYDLQTIDGKNWYRWGSEMVVANQQKDGQWKGSYPGTVDTCFALLFLRQANLAEDLTSKLLDDPDALAKLTVAAPASPPPPKPVAPPPPKPTVPPKPPLAPSPKPAPPPKAEPIAKDQAPRPPAAVPVAAKNSQQAKDAEPESRSPWLAVGLFVVALLFLGGSAFLILMARKKQLAVSRRHSNGKLKRVGRSADHNGKASAKGTSLVKDNAAPARPQNPTRLGKHAGMAKKKPRPPSVAED